MIKYLLRTSTAVAVFGFAAMTAANAKEVVYADIAPIFMTRCAMCHSGSNPPLDLHLDTMEGLLNGSTNGPVVIAGNPDDSELILRIKGVRQPRMPMTGPPFLEEEDIALIEQWVAAGMPTGPTAPAPTSFPDAAHPGDKDLLNYSDVKPILDFRCTKCHAARGLMGPAPEGYRLTSYPDAISTAERVQIVPNYPQTSELVRRIKGQSLPRMPFDGPPYLDEGEMTLMKSWIKQGAKDSENVPAPYPMGARVRVQGQLTEHWQLDEGLNLLIHPSTRIDKAPGKGDYVEVRGLIDKEGAIKVERIRRR
jgi:mono/diheme cytochrome c family protein